MAGRVKYNVIGTLVLVALVVSICYAVLHVFRTDRPLKTYVCIVQDRSLVSASGCDSLVQFVESLLDRPDAFVNVTVFSSSDASTSYEPLILGYVRTQTVRRMMEGRAALKLRRKSMLDALHVQCSAIAPAEDSRLLATIQHSVNHLHRLGPSKARRQLYVRAVLEQTTRIPIQAEKERRAVTGLPIVDNEGIDVRLCFTQSASNNPPRRSGNPPSSHAGNADASRVVWTKVFKYGELVATDASCR